MTKEQQDQALAAVGNSLREQRDRAEAALAEERRLRALPVIATCGACGWRGRATSANSAHLYCQHPADMPRRVDPSAAPPEWCPMRKGER